MDVDAPLRPEAMEFESPAPEEEGQPRSVVVVADAVQLFERPH